MTRMLILRPNINVFEIKKEAVLAQENIGLYYGWILPIFAVHEELPYKEVTLGRWDGSSDIHAHTWVALGNAEDVGDKFQLRLSWEHAPYPGVIPTTSNNVDVETTVLADRAAQYDQYIVNFVIDHNIDGVGNEIKEHELMAMRLRRIAATADEVTNDIIIMDWHDHWHCDKVFAPTQHA